MNLSVNKFWKSVNIWQSYGQYYSGLFFDSQCIVYQSRRRPNIVWLTFLERCRCSNEAKTRNLLKFVGLPQTHQRISGVSGQSSPYCEDVWRRYCCVTSLFPIADTCFSCKDIAGRICAMVRRWRFWAIFLHPVFSSSRVHRILDLHSKFALRPHHVWKYGRHPISDRWE